MKIDDKTTRSLATALNFLDMRQKLIASNVANAETPGYRAKKLDFEEALARALNIDGRQNMDTADNKHYDVGGGGFDNLKPDIYEDPNGVVSQDGNSVDIDHEMEQMAETKILYDAAVQLINKKLALMRYAISSER